MADRELWEKRYGTSELIHGLEPSDYLRANSDLLPRGGLALDLAAGEGRNALYLAGRGFEVIALDISLCALEKCRGLARSRGLSVAASAVDLTRFTIPPGRFDLIVNFNYLERGLAPAITGALRPGGLLVFETLATGHLRWKPDFNPEFLLRPGELVAMFRQLRIIKYREADIETVSGGRVSRRSVASLIAGRD
jgi:SAM-dependent methyltransferase